MLVHHLGHSSESKQRARGSSAWRGALDASILVSGEKNEIKVSCTKMKDSPEPAERYGWLEPVSLGWVDEDGLPIDGAVFSFFVDGDLRIPTPQATKLDEHKKGLEGAWFVGQAQLVDGVPYVSREAFKEFLIGRGIKETSVDQHLKQSAKQGMIIRDLIDAQIIGKYENGWLVKDRELAEKLIIKSVP